MSNSHTISTLGQNPDVKPDLVFKSIIVGNSGVGKTALVKKAIQTEEICRYTATIAPELIWNNYKIEDQSLCLQVWDTCGQEAFQSLSSNFYRSSSCVILVYSVDDRDSFIDLKKWINNAKNYINEACIIILVGNKSDLTDERMVTYEEGNKFKLDNNLDCFFETSVKENKHLKELVDYIIEALYKQFLNEKAANNSDMEIKSTVSIQLRESGTSIKKTVTKTGVVVKQEEVFAKNDNEGGSCGCV